VLIDDIFAAITASPPFQSLQSQFETLGTPPDQESLSLLRTALSSIDRVFSPPPDSYDGYTFTQDGDLLTITYSSPIPIAVDSIIVTRDSVTSPFIRGSFFGAVLAHDIAVRSRKVTIQLQTERITWPVVIAGGIPDRHSTFILANAAEALGLEALNLALLRYGAGQSCPFAIENLQKRGIGKDEAFFWCTRASKSDPFALVGVSQYLLEITQTAEIMQIQENILIVLAKMGLGFAFQQLGLIHLEDVPGFNSDIKLAIEYLTRAAEEFGIKAAAETLGRIYISGLGGAVPVEMERGIGFLRMAGMRQEKIAEEVREMDGGRKDGIAVWAWAAAAAVVAVAGLIAIRRLNRRL
jgi:hypothetical protein